MHRRGSVRAAAAAAAALVCVAAIAPAGAQTADTIRLIYPFAAGGAGDSMARLIAERVAAGLSEAATVENRTGAAGRIGVKAVVAAEPDGIMLLFAPMPVISIYPQSYPKLDYDPFRDLQPVALVATFEVALAVGPQMPPKSLAELVAGAKADPSQASYGSPVPKGSTPAELAAIQKTDAEQWAPAVKASGFTPQP